MDYTDVNNRRYDMAIRPKIILDDPTTLPPSIKLNIPDITATAGHIKEYTITLTNYFYGTCYYTKAKKAYTTYNPTK